MRIVYLGVAVLGLILGASVVVLVGRPGDGAESFAMWKWRAGQPFDSLADRAWSLQRLRFSCQRLDGPHQICAIRSPGIPVTGVPGDLTAFVDSSGIAVLVHFRPAIDSTVLRRQARRIVSDWRLDVDTITAAWALHADGEADYVPIGDRGVRSTWRSRGNRYIASMHEEGDMPVDLMIADVVGVRRLGELGAELIGR